jgi:hypothetical protein
MSDRTPRWLVIGFLAVSPLAVSTWVLAQQTPPTPAPTSSAPARNVPRPDDLEPGVNTSATPPPSAVAPGASTSGASAPADTTPPPAPKVGKPLASSKAAASAPAPTTNSVVKGGKAEDRLQLDTTEITGNQELPKVLYIVPWKRSDLGDLLGKPANSLLDEVLQPIDRDVFKRENRYYDALKPDAAGGADKGAGAASQGSGDKR